MSSYSIAVIAGDGIGEEVIDEGIRVINASADVYGFDITFEKLPWSCSYYLEHGELMPSNGLDILRGYDAIYLGAIGWPPSQTIYRSGNCCCRSARPSSSTPMSVRSACSLGWSALCGIRPRTILTSCVCVKTQKVNMRA
jgi:isocitrate/isopropylmalate dehydrogenase